MNYSLVSLMLLAFISLSPTTATSQKIRTFIAYYDAAPKGKNVDLSAFSAIVTEPNRVKSASILPTSNGDVLDLHYLNMIDIQTDNQLEPWSKDVFEHHQEFLLQTTAGKSSETLTPREKYAWGYTNPFDSTSHQKNRFFLNPTSKGWAEYYANLAKSTIANGSKRQGIFVDNVWQSIIWWFSKLPKKQQIDLNGDAVLDVHDDEAWVNGIVQFSKSVKEQLGPDIVLIANIGESWSRKPAGRKILQEGSFDGVMNEGFLHSDLRQDSSSYPNIKDWEANVNDILGAESLGKTILAQSLGKELDIQARQFCFASFLLGTGTKSYYNYRYRMGYDALFRFPEFELVVGNPVDNYRNVQDALDASSGLYCRRFDSVTVYVNPSGTSLVLPASSSYKILKLVGGITGNGGTMVWENKKSVQVDPHSAVIISRK